MELHSELQKFISEWLCNHGGVWHEYTVYTPLHKLCWRHLKICHNGISQPHFIKKIQRRNRYAYAISRQIRRSDYTNMVAFADGYTAWYFNAYSADNTIRIITGKDIVIRSDRIDTMHDHTSYLIVNIRDIETCFGSVVAGALLQMGCIVYTKR